MHIFRPCLPLTLLFTPPFILPRKTGMLPGMPARWPVDLGGLAAAILSNSRSHGAHAWR